jgi:photosystem II stability/assembly factor-like uncharacterized protein
MGTNTQTYFQAQLNSRVFWLLTVMLSIVLGFSSSAQEWRDGWNSHTRWICDIHIKENHDFFLFGGYPPFSPARSIFYVPEYGQHWYNWNVIDVDQGPWIVDVEYLSEETALAVGENGSMILTLDGGFTWDSIYGDTARDMAAIEFADSNFGLIAGGDSVAHIQTIKRTVDGGNNWISVRDVSGPFLRSIYCITTQLAIAVGDDGEVLKTVNGGNTWNSVSVPVNRRFQEVYFFDTNVGIIVGGDNLIRTILRTTDGGNTWSVIMNEAGGMLHDMHFINALTGYAVGDHGQFLTTTNGGVNWTFVSVPGMTSDDHFYTVNFHSEDYGILSGQWGRYFIYTNFDQPIVQTGSVTVENTGLVNFFGQVNSGGGTASAYFVYSTNPNLTNPDSTNSVFVNSTTSVPITQAQWILADNTTYYYTCKAQHLMGASTGDTLSFYADFVNGVTMLTDEPTGITATTATLMGHVQNLSSPATVWFEYNAYGGNTITVAGTPPTISDGGLYNITHQLNGLAPNTSYRYRLRVETSQNIHVSNYFQFYTGTPSEVETYPPTNLTLTSATFTGHVEFLHLPSDLIFHYAQFPFGPDFTIAGNPSLVTDENAYTVTANVSDLVPNRYYSYRLTVENPIGTLSSMDQVFFTGMENAVVTDPATGVTSTSAYLNGTVNEVGAYPATTWFQYYQGTNDTVTVAAFPYNLSSQQIEPVQALVNGLLPEAVYKFRVKVMDTDGLTYYGKERKVHTGENFIPNHDFESWTEIDVEKPDLWFNVMGAVEKITPGYNSDHAVKLEFLGKDHVGILLNGVVAGVSNNGINLFGGQPYTERPDSLTGMFRYDFSQGDSATVWVIFKSEGQVISERAHHFGGSSPTTYTQHRFPITFNSSENPDTVLIGFLVPNLEGQPPQIGSWIIVDDLKFNGNFADPSNGGFEDWTSYTFDHLDDWHYADIQNTGFLQSPSDGVVKRTSISQEGGYAVELHNLDMGQETGMAVSANYYIGGSMNLISSTSTGHNAAAFALPYNPQALHGYYKFFPENGDSLFIRCDLFGSNSPNGIQKIFVATEYANGFIPFTIDLNESNGGFPMDSASISVKTSGSDEAYGFSWAVIDNLRFDGFADVFDIIVSHNPLEQQLNPIMRIFPNPGDGSEIVLIASGEWEGKCQVRFHDALGRKVFEQRLPDQAGSIQERIDVTHMANGTYFVQLFNTKNHVTTLWIKR